MVLKELTVSELVRALSSNSVVYEIRGASVYFGYDLKGSAFFLDKELQTRTKGIEGDYLRVVKAIFGCIGIDTVNPRSIWMKCRLGKSKKLVQVVDIGSTGIALTGKKCTSFLNEINDIRYGHFCITTSPGVFSCHQEDLEKNLEEVVDLISNLDTKINELPIDTRKILFQKLEKFLLLNGRSKIEDWDVEDCKSILVLTNKGNIRIFRS